MIPIESLYFVPWALNSVYGAPQICWWEYSANQSKWPWLIISCLIKCQTKTLKQNYGEKDNPICVMCISIYGCDNPNLNPTHDSFPVHIPIPPPYSSINSVSSSAVYSFFPCIEINLEDFNSATSQWLNIKFPWWRPTNPIPSLALLLRVVFSSPLGICKLS